MKSLFKVALIALCLTIFNCKNENNTAFDYKYADAENTLKCDNMDTKLFNEALLSFEDDITKFYNPTNNDIRVAYNTFFRTVLGNRVNYEEVVSPHSMKVFEALKNVKDLWNDDNTINYNAEIFNCVSNNFRNKDLGTTFRALVSTNSMDIKLFGAPLQNQIKTANTDRYLGVYLALDLYYAHLHGVDASKVTEKPASDDVIKTEPSKPAMNQAPANQTQQAVDPHAGHNHD